MPPRSGTRASILGSARAAPPTTPRAVRSRPPDWDTPRYRPVQILRAALTHPRGGGSNVAHRFALHSGIAFLGPCEWRQTGGRAEFREGATQREDLGSWINDVIDGVVRNDVIHSGRGHDVITRIGNDRLAGGDGTDLHCTAELERLVGRRRR